MLNHITTVHKLSENGIGFKVLTGHGADIDTTTTNGKLVFGIFAALAEFEKDLIRERTIAGLAAARARGKKGGRKYELSKTEIKVAQSAMLNRELSVSELCKDLGIGRTTLYRYVSPNGELRPHGEKALSR